ncbi:MAG: hypothetical protein F6K11_16315 [Leptolyngbya sp. SIO3F4]|nr:hypothetical protein [Leptolyngbya sp. SIO3F4]
MDLVSSKNESTDMQLHTNQHVPNQRSRAVANRSTFAVTQKQAGDEPRPADIRELPAQKAREYMLDRFRKGSYQPPLVNAKGEVVQRTPKKSSYSGGDLFLVSSSDLNTGTDTSTGTRAYVNNSGTYKPSAVRFDYMTASTGSSAKSKVVSNPKAFETDNPMSDSSYSSGSYWDAGHKLGKQNGGLGDVNSWVFPQTPAYNQGNSKNMSSTTMSSIGKTRPEWREHEDDFHSDVAKNGWGAWWVKLM